MLCPWYSIYMYIYILYFQGKFSANNLTFYLEYFILLLICTHGLNWLTRYFFEGSGIGIILKNLSG